MSANRPLHDIREISAADMLAAIAYSLEHEIAPDIRDAYAASQCKTALALLRSVLVRLDEEGPALARDIADVRDCLGQVAAALPRVDARHVISAALAADDAAARQFPTLQVLADRAAALRTVLATSLPDLTGAERSGAGCAAEPQAVMQTVRDYLARHLARQRPWLDTPFKGEIR